MYFVCSVQDGMFKKMDFTERVIDVRPRHNCSSKTSVSLCCIDAHGKLFTIAFWLKDFHKLIIMQEN